MDILVMELDLIEQEVFHFQVVHLVKMFRVEMSFFAHFDNKKKDILVLGTGATQGLKHTLIAEKCTRLILL